MNAITTHVLDLSTGLPAAGVAVRLQRAHGEEWAEQGHALTDADGRVGESLGPLVAPGRYRLSFATGAYFAARGVASFHPEVLVVFEVHEVKHHHVPLLLSPFGYSTYRGS